MKTIKNVLDLSQKYIVAQEASSARRKSWNEEKRNLIIDTLKEIASLLIKENQFFASNLYAVDDDQTNVYIKSGNIHISGQIENGFQIYFALTINNKLLVYATPHFIDKLNVKAINIALIDDFSLLTKEYIVDLFYSAFEKASESSVLFE